MGKRIILFLLTLNLLLSLSGCRVEGPKFEEPGYLAHLWLDSTLLLVTTVADSLEVPWDIVVGPEDWIWFTQQKGTISRVHTTTGDIQELAVIKDVFYRKSTGLLSMVLHPDFENNPFVFVHYTYAHKDSNLMDRIRSRIIRFTFKEDALEDKITILDSIPGNTFHNGSRMMISNDSKLWIGTGDAGLTDQTQDQNTLNGKVLRLNPDGTIPSDNPFKESPVWSLGHRNVQGIAEVQGAVFISEHGPINDDEINLVEKGANYGWPNIHGFCDLDPEKEYCGNHNIREPLIAWTPTLGTAGLAYYNNKEIPEWKNSLLLCTLKGQSLRVLNLNEDRSQISNEHIFLQKAFGRIRDVAIGKEGEIYLTTSNLDWHPGHQPWMYDSLPTEKGDRIIKIKRISQGSQELWAQLSRKKILREDPEAFKLPNEDWNFIATDDDLISGQKLYTTHCAACHRPDGKGNTGQIPPLTESEWVSGDRSRLIDVMLQGISTPITVNGIMYEGEMPAYGNLRDDEISDILNFIRTEFGDTAGNIIAADVMHQRKGL